MKVQKINREDMLELTRRMTVKRNCFSRIAGAYMNSDGFIDGTFHTFFKKLDVKEQTKKLEIAKAVPYGKTNSNVKEYSFEKEQEKPGSMWSLLMTLKDCELKNDALLEVLYEKMGEKYFSQKNYGIFVYYGNYDVPLKANDKESLWESEEVYSFIICTICPLEKEYEPCEPSCGFLFPAFTERSSNIHAVDIYQADVECPHLEVIELFENM